MTLDNNINDNVLVNFSRAAIEESSNQKAGSLKQRKLKWKLRKQNMTK